MEDKCLEPSVTLTQIAEPEAVFANIDEKVINRTLGYAGFATRELMKRNKKLAQHPNLANSLTQKINLKKHIIYIRSWVDGKPFGAYGHALAKQSIIKSKWIQLKGMGRSGLEGVISRVNGNKTSGYFSSISTYYSKKATSKFAGSANFDSVRVQTGTRINTKGKIVPRYQTVYQLRSDSKIFDESGLLTFKLPNGEWRRKYETQIASRPESQFWVNWLQVYGNEAFFDSTTQRSIVTYLNNRLEELVEDDK